MIERLRHYWEARSQQERVIAMALAVAVVALLYIWLMQAAERERSRLAASVTTLKAQAARLEQQAVEYERLRARPAAIASTTDLPALVRAQAGASGVTRSLQRLDALDAGRVQVVLGSVAFADWLAWVSALASQQVRLAACRIEAQSQPGMVTVTATLVRARP